MISIPIYSYDSIVIVLNRSEHEFDDSIRIFFLSAASSLVLICTRFLFCDVMFPTHFVVGCSTVCICGICTLLFVTAGQLSLHHSLSFSTIGGLSNSFFVKV